MAKYTVLTPIKGKAWAGETVELTDKAARELLAVGAIQAAAEAPARSKSGTAKA